MIPIKMKEDLGIFLIVGGGLGVVLSLFVYLTDLFDNRILPGELYLGLTFGFLILSTIGVGIIFSIPDSSKTIYRPDGTKV